MEDYQSFLDSEIDSFYTAQWNAPNTNPLGRSRGEQVRQAIRTAAGLILRNIPLRLLNTQDGKIYTHKALITKFVESDKCSSLLNLTTTLDEITTPFIDKIVRSFFTYAMLSHRWEDDELTFKDVEEQSVYDLPGSRFHKVQRFCRQANNCGLDWAWVDTCCIDQTSSAEVQRAISSMFSWYSGSTLTIIYLSDVTKSRREALLDSRWFQRGWTLQELLAAKVIQIYKKDWSPFLRGAASTDAIFNDKDIAEILEALETATGIEQRYLMSYSPSVEHPRMKLAWARNRTTKEKEDEAYCLMGIFGITMTVTYGEGGNAFTRLLMEIMKRTGDATLLDWVGQGSSTNSCLPSSPRCFSDGPFLIDRSEMVFAEPILSLSVTAKLVLVFKKATRRAKKNSQKPSGNESPHGARESPTDGTLQIMQTRSNQGIIRPKRSIEVSLGQLLQGPLRPYELTAEIDIIIPCFTHKVLSLYFERGPKRYVCEADGVQSFSFVTSEELTTQISGHNSSSQAGYLLVRTWDPHLSYASSESNRLHSSMQLLRQRLATPFFAMLLEPSDHGRFKRISTKERIVAQLEQPPQTYGVQHLRIH